MKPRYQTALLTAAALAACGGSEQMAGIDGGGSPAPVATSVVAVGTITGFGSVIVNDVRYDTTGTTITVDGAPATEDDLAVGQVVVVRGTLDSGGSTGVALSIDSDDVVEGPISAIDTAAGTLTVVGQQVTVTATTSFDPSIPTSSLAGLNVDDFVEVSGFVAADGTIRATRISLESTGGEIDVTGVVADLNATTFRINDLIVDYSAAMLEDFPGGVIENGQRVEASGLVIGGAGELIATRVEFEEDDFGDDDIDQLELEGLITRFVSPADFDVEGIPVTTNAQTEFENGGSADLALNRKIEVEGAFNAAGVLVATEVEFEPEGSVEIRSLVEDVQTGQLSLLGLTVIVNTSTRFEDKSAAELAPFSLADVSVGDFVDVRGYEDGNGNIVATLLERLEFDNEVSLEGTVDSVTEPDFTILGVTVQTNGNTEFEDANEAPITPAEFFAQAAGATVEAEGTLLNGAIVADEVELED